MVSTYDEDGARPFDPSGWFLYEVFLGMISGNIIVDDPRVADFFIDQFFKPTLIMKEFTCKETDCDIVANLFQNLMYERTGLQEMKLRESEASLKVENKALKLQLEKQTNAAPKACDVHSGNLSVQHHLNTLSNLDSEVGHLEQAVAELETWHQRAAR